MNYDKRPIFKFKSSFKTVSFFLRVHLKQLIVDFLIFNIVYTLDPYFYEFGSLVQLLPHFGNSSKSYYCTIAVEVFSYHSG